MTAVSEGTLYLEGFAHSIATVKTESGTLRVAVPTMGVMQPLQIGESLSFSGPSINVNSGLMVNTRGGFIYRISEKSMAEYLARQMQQAQVQAKAQMDQAKAQMDQAKAQMDKAAKTGIPNAVPTFVMESAEQARESASKRQMDLLLALLSIIVAILAFERIPHLITGPVRWIKSRVAKRTDASGRVGAQQQVAADAPDSPERG